MIYLILILIVGINLSPFVLNKLDIWHAQGIFTQTLIFLIFTYSFFVKPKYELPVNKSIGLLNLWLGILTVIACFQSQVMGRYDIAHFFPYFNFLCMLILYKQVVQYLNIEDIKKVFIFMRYAIVATLLLCVLQATNRSQFFALLSQDPWLNNLVTGFIGNGTHLAGFLAMCSPLFFEKKRENILILILMIIILCTLTGTTKGDIALTGIITFIICAFYYLFNKNKKIFKFVCVGLLIFVCLIAIMLHLGIINILASKGADKINFLSDNGKFGLWGFYWKLSQSQFITGTGLGTVNMIYQKTPFPTARHVHLEYLHFLFESGLIGLIAILFFIQDFMRKNTKGIGLIFKCIFLGFLVSACFNYPMHLWLPSTYACISYACLVAWNERIKYDFDQKTN